jgi:putative N6-adenine-specific DNA methylase
LNEVLAAGMIMLSGWTGDGDFYDPMCGSGTLGIEAALIARNIPAGIFRKSFAFEKSPDYDAEMWENIFDNIEEKPWNGQIISSDIAKGAIRVAYDNARRAAVHKNIIYRGIDFREYPPAANGGIAILNPPYGERMAEAELKNLYRAIGNTLKKSFTGSSVWLISSSMEALKHIGLHPAKNIKLFNGALECKYQRYDIYEGSRKLKYQNGRVPKKRNY